MSGQILVGRNLPMKIKQSTIGEFIFDMADIHGPKVCQTDADTGDEETFASVKKRSIRTALELERRGVTSNDVIAFCSHNIMDNCIPVVAIAFLGATFSSLDPALPIRDIKHLLNTIKPKFLFVDDESVDLIEKSLDDAQLETHIIVFGESTKYSTFDEFLHSSKDEDSFKPVIVDSNQTATILFSSGTTGLAKAIQLSHSNLFHHINEGVNYDGNTPTVSMLHFTTLYWLSALLTLLLSFASGNNRVLVKHFNPDNAFNAIEKYKVRVATISPTIASKLITSKRANEYDLSSLSILYVGGSKISAVAIKQLQGIFKNAFISSAFATTESGIITIFINIPDDKKLNQEKILSCGKTSVRTMVKVVNPETEEILGSNQKGEIRCKSPGVMLGYKNVDPKEVFDNDGFYKTGDIGYYDDDECFFIVDRIKEIFKYLSFHIEPTAIEMVLLEHPAIVEACVFGVPVVECEEDGEYPAACVVLEPNQTVNVDEIINFVAERVIDRERLRGGVKIVDSLPVTPTGKMMRKLIREQFMNCWNK